MLVSRAHDLCLLCSGKDSHKTNREQLPKFHYFVKRVSAILLFLQINNIH